MGLFYFLILVSLSFKTRDGGALYTLIVKLLPRVRHLRNVLCVPLRLIPVEQRLGRVNTQKGFTRQAVHERWRAAAGRRKLAFPDGVLLSQLANHLVFHVPSGLNDELEIELLRGNTEARGSLGRGERLHASVSE